MILIKAFPNFLRFLSKQILSFKFQVKITGEEFLNLSKKGIVISNHLDDIDYLIPFFYLKENLYVLTKSSLLENPLIKEIMKNPSFYYLKNLEDIQIFKDFIQENYLFIYPEVDATKTNVIQPFQEPIIKLIYNLGMEYQLPVFPSGIEGTYGISQNLLSAQLFEKVKIQYNIGNPITIKKENKLNDIFEELQKQCYALTLQPERRSRSRDIIIRTEAREL